MSIDRCGNARWQIVLPLALLIFAGGARAEPPNEIMQDQPETGSYIKRPIFISENLSPDKPYEALSEKEKAWVRGQYEALPDNCEPPFPKNGLKNIVISINKINRYSQVLGVLYVTVRVDQNGNAKAVSVYETPDADLSKMVAFVLMKEAYKPASCDGTPYPMDFPFRINFKRWFEH